MAEYFLSGVAGWIGSLLFGEVRVLGQVENKLRLLKEDLETIQGHLQHTKTNERSVAYEENNLTIGKLRGLAYDAEDVIDTYIFKVHQDNGCLCRKYACFRILGNVLPAYTVGKEIDRIRGLMQEGRENLGVNSEDVTWKGYHTDDRNSSQRSIIYSYDDDREYIVGLDGAAEKLMRVLIGSDIEEQHVNVVSIVGMGGSGKTVLARKLYNHALIKEHFDCRAWVYISQNCNPEHVFTEILRKACGPEDTSSQLNDSNVKREALADKLRSTLHKKSYLVVLDDVWKEQDIRKILKALPTRNNTRSKIIITSRYHETIRIPELEVYSYEAQPLSAVDGWTLFSKIVPLPRDANYNDFESLGNEMLSRCSGLPLAVVALAGILRKKDTFAEWLKVKKAVQSQVMGAAITQGNCQSDNVKGLLALSYEDLPSRLKLCFLYLGICPEDGEISTGMVTRMWIAEGLVTAQGDMLPEEVAMQHFVELSRRFMIQVVRTNFKGEIKKVRLHDLLRDICINIAREQRFLEIYPPINSPMVESSASLFDVYPRRIALHSSQDLPEAYKYLRALVVLKRFCTSNLPSIFRKNVDVKIACTKFKLLRVLNLWGIETLTGVLPEEIGRLILLRYLSIRFTNITTLPISIGKLKYLLTLDYRNIEYSGNKVAIKIPSSLSKLERLRHLFLPIEFPWNIQELKLGTMCQLQTLWGVKQQECQDNNTNDWLSREMSNSSASIKKLKIVVSSKESLMSVFSCPSLKSSALHTLHCEMRCGVTLQDVEPLSQCDLLKLILIGRIQMDISLIFPTCLVMLELKDSMLSNNADPMATLGNLLTHLRFLRLINSYIGTTITCKADSFPKLQQLYLAKLENLEIWNIEIGAMPCLEKLEIITCRKLCNFPDNLLLTTTIQQFEFFEVPSEFRERAEVLGMTRGVKLPHNCEAILEHCDSSVSISSVHMLHEQLASGVFLTNKSKKYWLVKQLGCYNNCFMVYAKDLCISGVDGSLYSEQSEILERYMPPKRTVYAPGLNATTTNEDRFYKWCEINDSNGDTMTVIKVNPGALSFETVGQINTDNLSPEVTYEISYVIMLEGQGSGWKMYVDCQLNLPNGITQNRSETLNDRPRDEWVRVLVGEFKTSANDIIGELEFSFYVQSLSFWKVGLFIKGVIIEPKL